MVLTSFTALHFYFVAFVQLTLSFHGVTFHRSRLATISANNKIIMHAGHGQTAESDTTATVQTPKPYSFVQDEMRPYAMKLHTRDQAPKEGQQKAETPFTKWQPGRSNYLQFLVDSLHVYETLESIVNEHDALATLRNTGLERSAALKEDIQWMLEYDNTLTLPACGAGGIEYSQFLRQIAKESIPKFLCHYYNHYFAHTAGGRMIGAKMAELLLEKKVLKFYTWDGDVKQLLDATRAKIDAIASSWSTEEKQQCLEETMPSFKYGGMLMAALKPPSH
jgi:heme oxygenase